MKSIWFAFALLGARLDAAGAQNPVVPPDAALAAQPESAGVPGAPPERPRINAGRLDWRRASDVTLAAGLLVDPGRAGALGPAWGGPLYFGLEGRFGRTASERRSGSVVSTLTEVGTPAIGASAGRWWADSERGVAHAIRSELGGALGRLPYGANRLTGDPLANRGWGVAVGVGVGAVTLHAAHQNRSLDLAAPALGLDQRFESKNSLVGVSIRLGDASLYAAYSVSRGWGGAPLWSPDNPYGAAVGTAGSPNSRDVLIGIALPAGATTWLAAYSRKNDRSPANRDADQFAVGASYAVSHRTDFFFTLAYARNRSGAGYKVDAGRAASALNVGLRHGF
jgi:predicted porin